MLETWSRWLLYFQDFVLYVKVNVVIKVQVQVFRDPFQHVNITQVRVLIYWTSEEIII